jgi:hypothetical protein
VEPGHLTARDRQRHAARTGIAGAHLAAGLSYCLHIVDFSRYFYDFGALKPGDAGGPMIAKGAYRASVALAVLMGLFAFAWAQETPSKQAKPKSSEKNSESKAAPAKKGSAPAAKSAAAPPAAAGGGQPSLLGQFGDWGAYAASNSGKQVCYALAKPTAQATQPPNRPRDPAYIFVSTRPSENVRNEISIVIGYPFKPGSEANVDIGSAKYAMYTQADGAWIKNAAEEARMVDTMRRGSDLVVSGESGKGTKSTDRYNLRGLSQALDRVAQECK